jgi:hypothetical protein
MVVKQITMKIINNHSSVDREARERDKERLFLQLREYIDNNNPPELSNIKKLIKPLLSFGYVSLHDILTIVNAKIYPLIIENSQNDEVIISWDSLLKDLRMTDTRTQHSEQGSVESNDTISVSFVIKELCLYLRLNTKKGDVLIKKFRSKSDGTFKSADALIRAKGGALNRNQLYIKNTRLKDVPKSIGFTGLMRQDIIEYDSNNNTLAIRNPALISRAAFDELKNRQYKNSGARVTQH